MCTNQQSVDWITAALNGFQIREEVKLKATDTKHLHKPVKMTLRMRDKVSSGPEELFQGIKSLNPGLHTENSEFSILRMNLPVGDSSFL